MTDEAKKIRDAKFLAGYLRSAYAESAPAKMRFLEAADLIESLSAELEQTKRERDAAVMDLKTLVHSCSACNICAHYAFDEEDESRTCADCDVETCSNWQWCGVQKEE